MFLRRPLGARTRPYTAILSFVLLGSLVACSGGPPAPTGGSSSGSTGGGGAMSVTLACPDVPSGGGAPTIGAARMIDGQHVCFAFAEPMAPPTDVDPRAFRLSSARLLPAGTKVWSACELESSGSAPPSCALGAFASRLSCFDYAYDVFGDEGICEPRALASESTLYGWDYDTLVAGHLQKVTADSSTHFVGEISPLDATLCPADGGPPLLFLHYAPSGPPVVDEAGDALAAVGPTWAASPSAHLLAAGRLPESPVSVDASIFTAFCAGQPCTDGIVDGDESDVDCGGPTCSRRCESGQRCLRAGDCTSNGCHYSLCD